MQHRWKPQTDYITGDYLVPVGNTPGAARNTPSAAVPRNRICDQNVASVQQHNS